MTPNIYNYYQRYQEAAHTMFAVNKNEGEKFDKVFNQFRKNTRDLRLLQKMRDIMFHQREPNQRRKKEIARARETNRRENERQSYYA